jgi:hypothetical protein
MMVSVKHQHAILIDCTPMHIFVPPHNATSVRSSHTRQKSLQQTIEPSFINASLVLGSAKMLYTPALSAIVIFRSLTLDFVQLTCNYKPPKPHQGCLRGQTCLQDNSSAHGHLHQQQLD